MIGRLKSALLALPLLGGLVLSAGAVHAADAPAPITGLQVTAVSFDPTLQHNVENLSMSTGGQARSANFLDFYNQSGGVTRWGYPTSEVFQEEAGNLVQYYQRGVVDWHWRSDLNAYVLERRLSWDYFGGDHAGAGNDQGAEAANGAARAGEQLGPWGHSVSDVAADGTQTGFQAFFDALGGVQSFGYPKTDARVDTVAIGALHAAGATPGFIRQYFQGAVFEYHPDTPSQPVQLILLGDSLRNKTYPNNAWQSNGAFQPALALAAGQAVGLTSLTGGSLTAPALQVTMPSSVAQGHSFQLQVSAAASDQVSATMDGKPLHLLPQGGVWLAYVGFDPLAAVTSHGIVVKDGGASVSRTFNVTKVQWPVEGIQTTPQQDAVSTGSNVPDENNWMASYFLSYTPRQLWSGPFIYPVHAPLTDGFGVFRSYNGGPANTYHEGRDLGAWTGTPIFAAAAGKVVIARPLTVRGNGVVIDHGLGVFTGYYHQSKIAVQEGQTVQKGDLIGYVGATGFADGPHLHWELRIGNVYVDPDEWTKAAFGANSQPLSFGPTWDQIIPYRALLD